MGTIFLKQGVIHMHHTFGGWYYRIQSDTDTLAIIPAYHKSKENKFCSIQLITRDCSWNIPFSYDALHQTKNCFQIGVNHFSDKYIQLNINTPTLTAKGHLQLGPLSPIRYDIMGPFRYVPFMECRHIIKSMKHSVTGELEINGTVYRFHNAVGYLEGDRGRSFPKHYAWTQCTFSEGSLVASVAEIPIGPIHFTGIIAVVLWEGKEYRFATYLGAKVVRIASGEIIIQQGKWTLCAKLLEQSSQPLLAPIDGEMVRTIHEHVICRASYRFQIDGTTLFQFESDEAAFEYEYPI